MAQWHLDNTHSTVDFSVRHMMVTNVRGTFEEVEGTLYFDPENPSASSVSVEIQAASINTGTPDRDNHLRSADFFDVAAYPVITFRSTNVEMTGKDSGKVTGNLTIRDVTRPVTLDVDFLGQVTSPYGDLRAGFEATAKINREDFGLNWNQILETGGVLVGRDIKIQLAVQAVQTVKQQEVA